MDDIAARFWWPLWPLSRRPIGELIVQRPRIGVSKVLALLITVVVFHLPETRVEAVGELGISVGRQSPIISWIGSEGSTIVRPEREARCAVANQNRRADLRAGPGSERPVTAPCAGTVIAADVFPVLTEGRHPWLLNAL